MTDSNWNDDSIQFPRLLCEIVAACEIDYDALCASMDVTPAELHELFERAERAFEFAKDRTTRDLLRQKLALEAQRGEQEKTEWMTSMRDYVAAIEVPDDAWEVNDGCEPLGSRLAATLYVSGLPMHLEAWEVRYDVDVQVHDAGPEDLESLHAAVHGDGSFRTLTINGREYVIVASPFC